MNRNETRTGRVSMANEHKIRSVQPGSIAWEMGIEPGDRLLSVDGQEIEDVLIIVII